MSDQEVLVSGYSSVNVVMRNINTPFLQADILTSFEVISLKCSSVQLSATISFVITKGKVHLICLDKGVWTWAKKRICMLRIGIPKV